MSTYRTTMRMDPGMVWLLVNHPDKIKFVRKRIDTYRAPGIRHRFWRWVFRS